MQAPTSLRSTRLALAALLFGGIALTPAVAPSDAYALHSRSQRQVLHLTSHGHHVVRLQRLLGIPADGIFGPQTLGAVLRFQRRHHLVVDGVVGRHTWHRLARSHSRHHRHHHARRGRAAVLHVRSHGHRVVRLQRLLGIPSDGIFGPQTLGAVLRFQLGHALAPDGVVGRHTWRRLAGVHRRHHRPPRRDAGGRILHVGSTGHRVVRLQRLLRIPADGIFGPQTLGAVLHFQRRHNLRSDGRVGARTWHRLARAHRHRVHRHHTRRGHARGSAVGARVVRIARRYVGVPYVWAGASPSTGFDCSGLVTYVFGRVGVSLPHSSFLQFGIGRHVGMSSLRPGDLVFFEGLNHVGIWVGRNRFIHSPHSGTLVHVTEMTSWYRAHWSGATRVV
jgi:peptidoglycan hydrolase-like protein with peptidoglycan-binding domain